MGELVKVQIALIVCMGLFALLMILLQVRNPGEWLFAVGALVGFTAVGIASGRLGAERKGRGREQGETPN